LENISYELKSLFGKIGRNEDVPHSRNFFVKMETNGKNEDDCPCYTVEDSLTTFYS